MTPRYTFRVNPKRYRELYDRLESVEEGERSFWILEALLSKLAAEQGQISKTQPESILYSNPAMIEPVLTSDITETSEIENKLDQFAKMF